MNYSQSNDMHSNREKISHTTVDSFEQEFADYIGAEYALATSFGRTALFLGLMAVGVKGKEVILPAFTCTVVRQAVVNAGAIPIFVEVNYENFDLNIKELLKKINRRTKVIILTHYFGTVAANIENILEIGKKREILILEDCAHSLGAEFKGRKIGILGDLAIFSLTKGMVNFGGGVLTTNNKEIFYSAKKILQNEKTSILKKYSDYPRILAYGMEQMIDKLIFDRIKPSIFKWWLISLPAKMLILQKCLMIPLSKIYFYVRKINSNNTRSVVLSNTLSNNQSAPKHTPYPFSLRIDRVTAFIGKNQLKKNDDLIKKRKKIVSKVRQKTSCIQYNSNGSTSKESFTNVIMHFKQNNISEIIDYCKDNGILLRGTWPTHQKLWIDQRTASVKKLSSNVLIWNVNPLLTDKEINTFITTINTVCNESESSQ